MFDFYYQHGGTRRKSFKVKGEVCTIGSARSNDLVLDTKAIAKRHVELRLTASGVHITDLGSMSGTWVNRERVTEYGPLSDLDEIVVGDVSVVLDGMPLISDEFISRTSEDRGLEEPERLPVQSMDLEPSQAKPKRGRLFSFLLSDSDDETEDEQDLRKTESQEVRTGNEAASTEKRASTVATNTSAVQSQVRPNDQLNRNRRELTDSHSTSSDSAVSSVNSRIGSDSRKRPDSKLESPTVAVEQGGQPFSSPVLEQLENNEALNMPCATSEEQAPPHTADPSTVSADEEFGTEQTEQDIEMTNWSRIIHDQLLDQMDLRRKDVNRMTDEQLRDDSEILINQIIARLNKQLPDDLDTDTLRQHVLNEAVGLGPLEKFLEDDDITEIMVNNHEEIFIEKNGKLIKSKFQFSSAATVYSVIERIITPIGRRIDESSPIVDARLKDGSRVNAVIPPLALKGPSLTIRKFPKFRMQFSDLVKFGSTSQQMVDFFQICVECHKNIIVAGGTGSGKTTLLNVLSNFIPDADRIVTIEDAAELKLVQPNLVSLEARPPNLEGKGDVSIRDLVKNSLRMRPDRVVIGECRGGEAIDMLQAMNTGHDGSLTTIHANTPRDVISRLEVLVLMAGMDLPVTAIREQVASAVHLIVQQTRFPCGSRKITKVTEVVGIESGTVQLQDIFEFKQNGIGPDGKVSGVFRPTGFIPTFYDELRLMGMDVDIGVFDNSRVAEI